MKTIQEFLLVGCGGMFGAMCRYALAIMGSQLVDKFPVGTLVSNVLGCFLIGLLIGSGFGESNPKGKLLFGVGFLGALTTFSTFGAETIQALEKGDNAVAAINLFTNLTIGFLGVIIGMSLGRRLRS